MNIILQVIKQKHIRLSFVDNSKVVVFSRIATSSVSNAAFIRRTTFSILINYVIVNSIKSVLGAATV